MKILCGVTVLSLLGGCSLIEDAKTQDVPYDVEMIPPTQFGAAPPLLVEPATISLDLTAENPSASRSTGRTNPRSSMIDCTASISRSLWSAVPSGDRKSSKKSPMSGRDCNERADPQVERRSVEIHPTPRNMNTVSTKSSPRIASELSTTVRVVAVETPSAVGFAS